MRKLYHLLEPLFYISFGGLSYYFIEILYRKYSHYSMFLCGGIIFYLLSLFNRKYEKSVPLIERMIMSAFIITITELLFGITFNLILKRQVWDYSSQYYNYKGQICLTFSILWFFLSYPVFILEKRIRRLFDREIKSV